MNRVGGLRELVRSGAFVFCLRMDIHGVNLPLKARVFELFVFSSSSNRQL